MKLSFSDKVLLAFYNENQQVKPNFISLNMKLKNELNHELYVQVLKKLDQEMLLDGVMLWYSAGGKKFARADLAKPTSFGINYVEEKLGINPNESKGFKRTMVNKIIADQEIQV